MPTELRESDVARNFLVQGVWQQRLAVTDAPSIVQPLQCALTMAAADDVIPPTGFIADVIRLVLGETTLGKNSARTDRGLTPQTVRAYEDYVLGKLYADASFERASIAICRYAEDDRIKAIAWLLGRICDRIQFNGVIMSPAVARSLQGLPPDDVLILGAESLRTEGLMPLLKDAYNELISGVRTIGEVLSTEDVFELEKGTALIEFGQRLAVRQTLRAAEEFAEALPRRTPRPTSRQRNVPTHILEEDTYPVGGFTSISTRGSIESLLHSELAYMEVDQSRRPDLFEIKYVRSELLYYSRDENEFQRRRRAFQFVLLPDLQECRIKDEGQNYQRLILILAIQVTLVRKLIDWLSDDALLFEFLFVNRGGLAPLQDEREMLEMILQEQIQNGTVTFSDVSANRDVIQRAEEHARRSTTHCLIFSTQKSPFTFDQAMPTSIIANSSAPKLLLAHDPSATECLTFEQALDVLTQELV